MLTRELERVTLREGERLTLLVTRPRSWSDSYGLSHEQVATLLAAEERAGRGGTSVAVRVDRDGCTREVLRAHHDGETWRLGGGVA